VRGLDYYTRTAFEIKTGELGAQDAVAGGGRYDNLSSALGGPPVPGVGFAAGMERMILLLAKKYDPSSLKERPLFYLAPLDRAGEKPLLQLASFLGEKLTPFYLEFGDKGLKYHLKKAQKMGIKTVIIVGREEKDKEEFIWKDMSSGEQMSVNKEKLLAKLLEEKEKC
jgi:histidyl-tRNA synthetase